MKTSGLYIHIPFCVRRCGYCDFNTFAGQSHFLPKYIDAVCQELKRVSKHHGEEYEIDSIYFGGGTPSLLTPSQLENILKQTEDYFTIQKDCEIGLEANPGTVSAEAIRDLSRIGFKRISFGMQSAHPRDLAVLDRRHRYSDVVNAVKWSRQAGFSHVNLDLIFGIPGQSLERWQHNLSLAAQMEVDHLSLYSLILEEGTPLYQWYKRGLLDTIDDDLTADMYEYAMDSLAQAGFEQYEISNWARKGVHHLDGRCRHNLNTWRYHPYFGIGAGAHGFINGTRTANVTLIPDYIERMNDPQGEWPAAETALKVCRWDQMQEWMMLGLRVVNEGVSSRDFFEHFQVPMELGFGTQIRKMCDAGLLEKIDEDRLHLTRRGIMLGNRVFTEFVGNEVPDFLREGQ
jgi:oxygen-independent coproporphyrinogen III oxidase